MLPERLRNPRVLLSTPLVLLFLLAIACGGAAPAATPTQAPAAAPPAATEPTPVPEAQAAPTATPSLTESPDTVLTDQRLHVAITPLPQDAFLPWMVSTSGLLPMRPMWENLSTIHPSTGVMEVYPELATGWEMSPDATTYTFHLRKGVPFHFDWGELTVQDFITTLDQAIVPGSLTGCRGTMISQLGADSATAAVEKGTIQIIDDHTFTIHLTEPQVDLATWWFNTQGRPCSFIWSSAQFEAQGEAMFERGPAGTGPYQFVQRRLKEFTEMERVPYQHWRVDAEFKTLRITTTPEDLTRLAMLLAGEVDMADIPKVLHDQAVDAGLVVLGSDLPSAGLHLQMFGQYHVSGVNYRPDIPWAAPGETGRLVREAFNRAVDRNQIINVLFRGRGEPMYNTIFHSSLEGWNPEWETRFEEMYGYDPERAKQLLDQAGFPGQNGRNRFAAELWVSSLPGLPETIEVSQSVAQSLEEIGVNVRLVEVEFARALDAFRDRHDAHFLFPLRVTLRPVDANMRIYYYTGPIDPNTGIPSIGGGSLFTEDPLYDETFEQLVQAVDPAERHRLAQIVGDHTYENYRTIPIVYLNTTIVANPDVVGEYRFGGGITGEFGHLEYAKVAR